LSRICLLALVLLAPSLARADFVQDQKQHVRVKSAFANKETALRRHFAEKRLAYPPREIFLRVLKREKELELWANDPKLGWSLLKSYPFCYASGRLGPKRKQGDLQVPEGFYHLDRFNPSSNYHLSLGVSYPNQSDRILGAKGNLGGDIFIHGDCVSIGCVAITDDKIEEVYALAVMARARGQRRIPIHIFPGRLDEAGLAKLSSRGDAAMLEFWKNLADGYRFFEEKKKLPRVRVGADGRYLFSGT
jgi:murein L,D-transpeptidase YafK